MLETVGEIDIVVSGVNRAESGMDETDWFDRLRASFALSFVLIATIISGTFKIFSYPQVFFDEQPVERALFSQEPRIVRIGRESQYRTRSKSTFARDLPADYLAVQVVLNAERTGGLL